MMRRKIKEDDELICFMLMCILPACLGTELQHPTPNLVM